MIVLIKAYLGIVWSDLLIVLRNKIKKNKNKILCIKLFKKIIS